MRWLTSDGLVTQNLHISNHIFLYLCKKQNIMKNKDSNRLTVETTKPLLKKNVKKITTVGGFSGKKEVNFTKNSAGPRPAPNIKVVKKPN